MAKMTKEIRRAVFTGAIMQLYGDRFKEEEDIFRRDAEACVERLARREAEKLGVEYDTLTSTTYRPYVHTADYVNFRCPGGIFTEQIQQAVFSEDKDVLEFEGAKLPFDTLCYPRPKPYIRVESGYVLPGDIRSFDAAGKEEILAVYKRYGDFMREVIASACLIRDVLNSVSATKQLEETSPDLAAFIPAQMSCTALVPVATIEKVKVLFALSPKRAAE